MSERAIVLEGEWPLVCLSCRGQLESDNDALRCASCATSYPIRDGVPLLLPSQSAKQKEQQAAFFDGQVDSEFELERPLGTPLLYGWLLKEKFRRSIGNLSLQNSTALAVCGGSGLDAEFLARAGARVISSDISLEAARRARERGRRHGFPLDVIVTDVEHLPFPDRSIDVVYVHDGLHHLERPLEGLAEMARVARRFVCVTEPARAAATRLAVKLRLALEHEEAGNQVARLAIDEIATEFRTRGFRVLRAERYALFYRHEPGPAMRLFSLKPLFPLARLALAALNMFFGSHGNKLAVLAERTESLAAGGVRAR